MGFWDLFRGTERRAPALREEAILRALFPRAELELFAPGSGSRPCMPRKRPLSASPTPPFFHWCSLVSIRGCLELCAPRPEDHELPGSIIFARRARGGFACDLSSHPPHDAPAHDFQLADVPAPLASAAHAPQPARAHSPAAAAMRGFGFAGVGICPAVLEKSDEEPSAGGRQQDFNPGRYQREHAARESLGRRP